MSSDDRILFRHVHPGNWVKTIVARNTVNESTRKACDPYLYAPDGSKLRSSNDLLDYLYRHPEYWLDFDATTIHLERWESLTDPKKEFNSGTKKVIQFLEAVRAGVDKDVVLAQLNHVPKDINAPKTPRPPKLGPDSVPKTNFRRKNYGSLSLTSGRKSQLIGPKSVMMKHKSLRKKRGLNREAVIVLEEHFVKNICKPNSDQIHRWAHELNVPVDVVFIWFQNKWRGKLEYEALKLREKETSIDSYRTRQVRKFDPEIKDCFMLDDDDDEDECIIEYENAEDDC